MPLEESYRKRLEKLATCNLSDAMEKLGYKGAALGILPLFDCQKVIGPAMTVKITAAGKTASKHHLGIEAINDAEPGDVIVIDNAGRLDVACWGDVLGNSAKFKGLAGVVIDGAARDVDENQNIGFPVYARTAVPVTARGRIMQESYNCLIQLSGVQVRPGDIIVGDKSGVVVIPREDLDKVIETAEAICKKEEAMVEMIKSGVPLIEVDTKFNYEQMLKKES